MFRNPGINVYQRTARSFFAILVVLAHVVFVSVCAVFLQDRITSLETYLSTMAVFLPVFGIYVGIVVKATGIRKGPRGPKVSGTFLTLMGLLFVAYLAGNIFVLRGYGSGFIASEEMLPAAFALVETAFGGFFTTLFLTLFGEEG